MAARPARSIIEVMSANATDHDAPAPPEAAAPRKVTVPTIRRSWLRYMLPAAALVVLAGGAGLAAFATDTVESYWDGVWWSISLMTTVGWSGPGPTTVAGHLIASVTMLTGFLLLAFVTAAIASVFVREDETPVEQAELDADSEILREVRALREELAELTRERGTPE